MAKTCKITKETVDFIKANMNNRSFQYQMQLAQIKDGRKQFRGNAEVLAKIDQIEKNIHAEFSDLAA